MWIFTIKGGKPTPLGVGWIAQNLSNIKQNRFRHEPNAIANSFNGMIGSKSLNETD